MLEGDGLQKGGSGKQDKGLAGRGVRKWGDEGSRGGRVDLPRFVTVWWWV